MSDPSSSQPLPCLKDLQGPQRPAEGAGGARSPGAGWKGGSRLAQGTCACLPAQGRDCLPEAAKETPRDVSAQDTLPPPLTAASETARPHLDHWASSAASLRASSGDCCIGQGLPGRSESGARLPPSRLTGAAPPKSTCQSQRRFRPALPGLVAPGRPPRGQGRRQAGRASWSPPRRRPSGSPGRAPGSEARPRASLLLRAAASCPGVATGAPAARGRGEALQRRSAVVILAPGAGLDTSQSRGACVPHI